jgi:hypothetical protein
MAQPLTVAEVDRAMSDLPRVLVGVEQEYKWRVDPVEFLGTAQPSPQALERVLPLPPGTSAVSRFRHAMSSIYFDDDWYLAEHGLALKAQVNPRQFRNVCWLAAKQTISWVDGCRDSLEISERIAPEDIHRELSARATLPLRHLDGQCRRPVTYEAYATTTQVRHKVHLRTGGGTLFQATFDVASTTLIGGNAEAASTEMFLEIETTSSELRPRGQLDAWARQLSEVIGHEPEQESKPQRAAALAGWAAAARGDR